MEEHGVRREVLGGALQVLQGELISEAYFDAMAAEVAEMLQATYLRD